MCRSNRFYSFSFHMLFKLWGYMCVCCFLFLSSTRFDARPATPGSAVKRARRNYPPTVPTEPTGGGTSLTCDTCNFPDFHCDGCGELRPRIEPLKIDWKQELHDKGLNCRHLGLVRHGLPLIDSEQTLHAAKRSSVSSPKILMSRSTSPPRRSSNALCVPIIHVSFR